MCRKAIARIGCGTWSQSLARIASHTFGSATTYWYRRNIVSSTCSLSGAGTVSQFARCIRFQSDWSERIAAIGATTGESFQFSVMVNLINMPFHEGSVRETAGLAGRGGRIISTIFSTLNTTQAVTRIPRRIQRTDFVSREPELQDFSIEAVKPSEAKFVSQFRRFDLASIPISKTALAGAHSGGRYS